jgi:hypothetical protein
MRIAPPLPARLLSLLFLALLTVASPLPVQSEEPTPEPGEQLPERLMDPQDFRRAMYRMQHEHLWLGARAHRAKAIAERTAAQKVVRRGKRKAGARPVVVPPSEQSSGTPSPRRLPPLVSGSANAMPLAVRANDPTGDAAGGAQSEISLAALGNDVVVSWNDGDLATGNLMGVGTSSNGGASFTDEGTPPAIAGWLYAKWGGDPVVAVDESAERFYVAGLASVNHDNASSADSTALAIASRFKFGGWLWSSGRVIRTLNNTDYFLDKEWIAADSSNGNVYVIYTLYNHTVGTNFIQFQRSTDGGITWSSAVTLSSPGDAGDVQGARIAVGPDGKLNAVWIHNNPSNGLYDLRFRRSFNFGLSWSSEVTAGSYHPMTGTGPPGFNRARGVTFPSLAVDRTNGDYRGRVYIAYSEVYDFLDEVWAVQPSASSVRFEDLSNNSSATADPFTAGNTLKGTAGFPDEDWWSVTLTAGQHLEVWADSTGSASNADFRIHAFAPDLTTRLGFSAMTYQYATSAPSFVCLYAAVSGTYYLRVRNEESNVQGYRIRTRIGQTDGGFSRDRRDPLAIWSDDGVTWSTPQRITDGPVGSDDSFPELAVGQDGFVYATWLDARDDDARAATSAYIAHSADGGASWEPNVRLSTIATDFSTLSSNLAPNMGDYVGLAPGNLRMHAAWPDGRNGTPDVYTSSFSISSGIQSCAGTALAPVLGSVTLTREFQNVHDYARNYYTWTWTDTKGWLAPQVFFPFNLAPDEVIPLSTVVTVPPGTAQGVFDDVCLTVTNQTGAIVRQCCTRVTVSGSLADVEHGGVDFALHPVTPNPVASRATMRFGLPRAGGVSLAIYDVTGARVRTLVNGERAAGEHTATWDGRDDGGRRLGAGAYFVKLAHGGQETTQRVVLLQ